MPKHTSCPTAVLCVGKMGDDPSAAWNNRIKRCSENNHYLMELNRIDGSAEGVRVENIPRIHARWTSSTEIQNSIIESQCDNSAVRMGEKGSSA